MRHATLLLYHVCAVASRNIRFASCGTSGKLTLWTRYVRVCQFVLHGGCYDCFLIELKLINQMLFHPHTAPCVTDGPVQRNSYLNTSCSAVCYETPVEFRWGGYATHHEILHVLEPPSGTLSSGSPGSYSCQRALIWNPF
jgi:hypothetical protein